MPSEVTKKEVWQIAETLAQEDRVPTVVSVRSWLGGGNPHAIASHLASWRAKHREEETLFRTDWEVLMAAQEEMEQERIELMEEIERLDGELEEARKELATGAHVLDVERKALERVKTQGMTQEQHLKEALENAKKLAEQKQSLRIELATMKEEGARTEELKAQLEKLQGGLAGLAERGKAEKADQGDTGKLAEQNQALRIEVATLKERAAQAETLKDLFDKLQGELTNSIKAKETGKEDTEAPRTQAEKPQGELAGSARMAATGKDRENAEQEEGPKGTQEAEKKTVVQASRKSPSPSSRASRQPGKPGTVKK
uniref:Plasmid replication region DNA-binding N-term n=1 Tax=Candidatus Kentrum eta TaxID=2126337 RepID=A0A450ULS6_9GAMM|nr:MAG: Plasmid replication region DNA-binding N-term [Candidatus Kentron sp. H]VFJ93485.1 MAG: Plasmid replication region DNA-binding N-term [Candidatus Kentron sp. H]VFK00271.1 MAG: Plasmid replication region DNA-binding N-term [Candidatus Kentron sp. H]